MPCHALLSTFAALAVIVGASNSTRADSGPRYIIPPAATLPVMVREAPHTVLTMAPDGSWGVSIRQAITEAKANSVTMHEYYMGSKGAAACAEWKKHIAGLIRQHFQADDITNLNRWHSPAKRILRTFSARSDDMLKGR